MRREHVELDGRVLIAYGHFGRPVLVFPSEAGLLLSTQSIAEAHSLPHAVGNGPIDSTHPRPQKRRRLAEPFIIKTYPRLVRDA